MQNSNRNHYQSILMLLIGVIFVTAVVMYFGVFKKHVAVPPKIDGMYLENPQAIDQFSLTDNKGKAFNQEDLKGHWTMLFFGFTNCGMVCPTTMSELNKMYKGLEQDLPKMQLPQVVLISVDPERDTVKRMNEYVTAFNPNFIGLRGEESAISHLKTQLHIVSAKMQSDLKANYTINHSAEIMLVNPKGELQAYLSYPHQALQMQKDYKLIINA